MAKQNETMFYHATTRKLIAAFGALFNNIQIQFEKGGVPYKVPVRFATREKHLTYLEDNADLYLTKSAKQTVWLSFDFVGMNYASERATNNTQRLKTNKEKDESEFMYNRVPYDLTFQLYISSKQFEHSLMIVEQILPLFKPALNITLNEIDSFRTDTDISIALDSVQPEIEMNGASVNEDRTIMWTLGFTMKAWYYPVIEKATIIKQAEVILRDDKKVDEWFSQYISEVKPKTVNSRKQKHEIVDTIKSI